VALWTSDRRFIEQRLARARAAMDAVTATVRRHWQETHGDAPMPDVAEAARRSGLPAATVQLIELLVHLQREIFTMVNRATIDGLWQEGAFRRALAASVKELERGARDVR
jgi:hypothetical protein